MTNDEIYLMESLSTYNLDEEEKRFIDYHLFASHQPLTQEQHDKLIKLYDKYLNYGVE